MESKGTSLQNVLKLKLNLLTWLKNSSSSFQKKDPTVKLVLSDQEDFRLDLTSSGFDNRVEGNPITDHGVKRSYCSTT